MAPVATGKPFGVATEFFQGFDEAAGDDQADNRQQHGHQEACREDVAENLPERVIDRGKWNGRAHHPQRLTVVAGRHGHITHGLMQRLAGTKGDTHALVLVQCVGHLQPGAVVVHLLRHF